MCYNMRRKSCFAILWALPRAHSRAPAPLMHGAKMPLQASIFAYDRITGPKKNAPLAQMDRAQASDAWCRRFESAMVRQTKKSLLALFYLVFHGPLLDRTQFCLQNCRRGANRLLYLIHRFPLAPKFGSESAYIPLNPPRIP